MDVVWQAIGSGLGFMAAACFGFLAAAPHRSDRRAAATLARSRTARPVRCVYTHMSIHLHLHMPHKELASRGRDARDEAQIPRDVCSRMDERYTRAGRYRWTIATPLDAPECGASGGLGL